MIARRSRARHHAVPPGAGAGAALRARLRDTRGFMLAEQVVSIAFIGLLCVAVAAGLSAALSAYSDITTQTNAQQLLARTVDEVNGELTYARSGEGNQFISQTTRTEVQLISDDQGIVMQRVTPPATSRVLVGAANGLLPTFEDEPIYDFDTNTWSYTVVIKDSGMVDILRQEMKVVQVNPSVATVGQEP